MSTEAQITANQMNAFRSTGPRTIEGKQLVSRNALQHGLAAETLVLASEDAGAFERFAEDLRVSLSPVGAIEDLLVERVIASAWRLRRAHVFESGVLAAESSSRKVDTGLAFWRDAQKSDALGKVTRYVSAAERSMMTALHELQRLQAGRNGMMVAPPAAVDVTITPGIEVTDQGLKVG